MREHPVPCKNATKWECDQGQHITWNDDAECNPCKRVLDRFATRRALHEQIEEPPTED